MTQLRPDLQELKNKIGGQDVFIIGGGPSLRTFDFNKLNGKITIALNSSYLSMDKWTAIFWADGDWASKHMENLDKIDCLKFTPKKFADEYVLKNIKALGGATVLKKGPDYGYSLDLDTVAGNNSGAMALNLIANMKPYRIFLLGYDMGFTDGNSHHHAGYEVSDPNVYPNLFIPSLNIMAPILKGLGIEIINCNPLSYLNCFNKDDINKYL